MITNRIRLYISDEVRSGESIDSAKLPKIINYSPTIYNIKFCVLRDKYVIFKQNDSIMTMTCGDVV